MIKTLLKWLLTVCFKAVLNEIVIEYTSRKEVVYEKKDESPEK